MSSKQYSHRARQSVQKPLRILICGDRNWTDGGLIYQLLADVDAACVIEGKCRGADQLACKAAEALNIPVQSFPADWGRYGGAAGPIRNQQMLDEGKPNIVWAFHDDLTRSAGTKNMIQLATKARVLIKHIAHTANGFVVQPIGQLGFPL